MADGARMQIDIPGVNFEQLAREAIATRLSQAMIGADDAIVKIVVAAMEQKVNDRGIVDTRGYDNKTPFIEWLAQDLMRKTVVDVVSAKIDSLRPALEKAVEAELKRSAHASAKVLVQSLSEQAKSGYGFEAKIVIAQRERS